MRHKSRWVHAAAALQIFWLSGCSNMLTSDTPTEDSTPSAGTQQAALQALALLQTSDGRTWSVQTAPVAVGPDVPKTISVGPGTIEDETHDFRAVRYANGMEYREVDIGPKFLAARAAYRAKLRGYLGAVPNNGIPLDPNPTPQTQDNGEAVAKPNTPQFPDTPDTTEPETFDQDQQIVSISPFDVSTNQALRIGVDNRIFLGTAPYTVYLESARSATLDLSGCSGTMIGTRTAISAAHCFYNRSGTPGWIMSRINGTWGIGRVVRAPNSNPTAFSTTYTYGPHTGCMTVTIPANYINNATDSGAWLDDFAVIEFGCGYQPGSGGNSYPPCYGADSDYTSATMSELIAYDGLGIDLVTPPATPLLPAGMPVAQNVPNFTMQQPTLVTRFSYSPAVSVSNSVLLSGNAQFDATGGSSGGGLLSTLFSSVGDMQTCWIGSVIGATKVENITTGTTTAYLSFRRLTSGSWGFIVGNTSEW